MKIKHIALMFAIMSSLFLISCTPEQIAVFKTLDPASQQAVINHLREQSLEAERRAVQQHPFLRCVRAHESDEAGSYLAVNPSSGASGAYQFLDSTWRNVSGPAGYPGYARALYAPWWVQDAVALWTYRVHGANVWYGTGCY